MELQRAVQASTVVMVHTSHVLQPALDGTSAGKTAAPHRSQQTLHQALKLVQD